MSGKGQNTQKKTYPGGERDILLVREYQNLQRILYERKKRKRSG